MKLSAEVCDLSEDMRSAMDKGASGVIALLADTLEKGRNDRSLTLYSLWLGANLQAKISRSALPLESALAHANSIIATPV